MSGNIKTDTEKQRWKLNTGFMKWEPIEKEFCEALRNENLATIDRMLQRRFYINKLLGGYTTPLIYAILNGKKKSVQLLLDRGADVLTKLEHHDTPLSVAATVGDLDIVKLLIENGAKPTMQTAFLVAIEYKRFDTVRYMVEKGAIINWKYKNGDTPLSKSIRTGSGEIAAFLIDNGANLGELSTGGYTPLGLSIRCHMFDVMAYLMQKGANIDQMDNKGRTALAVAAHKRYFILVQYLIESGANIHLAHKALDEYAANDEDFDIYLKTFKMEHGINWESIKSSCPDKKEKYHLLKRSDKESHVLTAPLKQAVQCEDMKLFRSVLRRGADVLVKFGNGETPLSTAVKKGNLRMVRLLIENGAKESMQTALLDAIENKNLNIVRYMVGKGVFVNWKYKNGDTPLSKSIIAKSAEIVKLLLDKGADVGAVGTDGYTPLGLSVKYRMFGLLKYLIQKDAVIDQIDNNGRTALAVAASVRDLRLVKYLIESGADMKLAQNEIDEYAVNDEDFDIYLKMYKMEQSKKKETNSTTSNGLLYQFFRFIISVESESAQEVTSSSTSNQQWLLYRHF